MLAITLPSVGAALVCLLIGFLIALIVCFVLKGQLKSVRFKQSASDYVRHDTFTVTRAYDIFLYRNVTRTPKPQPQNKK
ncbi:MAG: hypothetical protein IKU57_04560 [Oscillospiraceae bacterium]|nr:hypothetical protein [Oscillospiraceae bacterium]